MSSRLPTSRRVILIGRLVAAPELWTPRRRQPRGNAPPVVVLDHLMPFGPSRPTPEGGSQLQ